MYKYICIAFLLFCVTTAFAQDSLRIDPPFWWNNLKNQKLQILLYQKNIALSAEKVSCESKLVKIDSVKQFKNRNYLLLYLDLQHTQEQELTFSLSNGKRTTNFKYNLYTLSKDEINPVDENDIMYLVFPDRFANGNEKNDAFEMLQEKTCNRNITDARHGGDLAGIKQHIAYFKELGISALWLNPTLINDQEKTSYHGYALTDHYRTDPRLGSNHDYKELSQALRQQNIKIVWDLVPNHIGSNYWMLKDLVDSNIVHRWDTFTRTNYRASSHFDPHVSAYEKKQMTQGWFDYHMPDVNDDCKWFSTYLMQSYLWWINYAGIDGFRIDTYSYNNLEFMNACLAYIKQEYPNFYSSGEVWEQAAVDNMAYFADNTFTNNNNQMMSNIDFQLYWSIYESLKQAPEWDRGLSKIYFTLSHDYLYKHAEKNLIFIENHDLDRAYALLDSNYSKWQSAMLMLFTLRGVPCLYQGGEILMSNPAPRKNDGDIRHDFPGGWRNDPINKFDAKNLKGEELEAYRFTQKLCALKKEYKALRSGQLMHYAPFGNDTYCYFRYDDEHCIMIAINRGKEYRKPNLPVMHERIQGAVKATDLLNGQTIDLQNFQLAPESFVLLKIK